jgi:hypothetical protein
MLFLKEIDLESVNVNEEIREQISQHVPNSIIESDLQTEQNWQQILILSFQF